jgi:hypothetical protein
MLPPQLARLRDALKARGITKRTSSEESLLDELLGVESTLDEARRRHGLSVAESYRMRASGAQLMGPAPGKCPTCGGNW